VLNVVTLKIVVGTVAVAVWVLVSSVEYVVVVVSSRVLVFVSVAVE
jgi:hypothetical protein